MFLSCDHILSPHFLSLNSNSPAGISVSPRGVLATTLATKQSCLFHIYALVAGRECPELTAPDDVRLRNTANVGQWRSWVEPVYCASSAVSFPAFKPVYTLPRFDPPARLLTFAFPFRPCRPLLLLLTCCWLSARLLTSLSRPLFFWAVTITQVILNLSWIRHTFVIEFFQP